MFGGYTLVYTIIISESNLKSFHHHKSITSSYSMQLISFLQYLLPLSRIITAICNLKRKSIAPLPAQDRVYSETTKSCHRNTDV